MTKTLADLTPEQRANCVGMWANVDTERYPAVIVRTYAADDVDYAQMLCPELNDYYSPSLAAITPRPDLPRAWAPNGQPVPGEWEDGHVVVSYDDPDPWILKDAVSIEGLSEGGMSYYDAPPNGIEVKLDKLGEGEGKARRWVGEWEQA
ncbi:hypothetical protein [Corynebacterium striatum]|uniref:hypothetical protein n=1 Tax=Corynebacterium striatum TaxID=43770 RepID=UPI003F80033C